MLDDVTRLSISYAIGMLMDVFNLSFAFKIFLDYASHLDDVPPEISTIVIQQFYQIYDFFLS